MAIRCSVRPGVMIEAEDHRTAKEAGCQGDCRHAKQREPEQPTGPVVVAKALHFADQQDQCGTGHRKSPSQRCVIMTHDGSDVRKPPVNQPRIPAATAVTAPNQTQ